MSRGRQTHGDRIAKLEELVSGLVEGSTTTQSELGSLRTLISKNKTAQEQSFQKLSDIATMQAKSVDTLREESTKVLETIQLLTQEIRLQASSLEGAKTTIHHRLSEGSSAGPSVTSSLEKKFDEAAQGDHYAPKSFCKHFLNKITKKNKKQIY